MLLTAIPLLKLLSIIAAAVFWKTTVTWGESGYLYAIAMLDLNYIYEAAFFAICLVVAQGLGTTCCALERWSSVCSAIAIFSYFLMVSLGIPLLQYYLESDWPGVLFEEAMFTITILMVHQTLKGLKERLRDLQREELDNYTARICATTYTKYQVFYLFRIFLVYQYFRILLKLRGFPGSVPVSSSYMNRLYMYEILEVLSISCMCWIFRARMRHPFWYVVPERSTPRRLAPFITASSDDQRCGTELSSMRKDRNVCKHGNKHQVIPMNLSMPNCNDDNYLPYDECNHSRLQKINLWFEHIRIKLQIFIGFSVRDLGITNPSSSFDDDSSTKTNFQDPSNFVLIKNPGSSSYAVGLTNCFNPENQKFEQDVSNRQQQIKNTDEQIQQISNTNEQIGLELIESSNRTRNLIGIESNSEEAMGVPVSDGSIIV